MKKFNGKAIYNPSGRAGEYSYWACNFYVGCSNGCEYCYCKKGILKGVMGQDKPQLKKCFINESHALKVFTEELLKNLFELQKHGLFFSFTTDPMLPGTQVLTMNAAGIAIHHGIPAKILTKCASWVKNFIWWINNSNSDNAQLEWRKMYAFGFTLTGHDELEPNASTNAERIEAMKKLQNAGFKTFASIEPIIDLHTSFEMISATNGYCDLYKIGLMSGVKMGRHQLQLFIKSVIDQVEFYGAKLYFKDSLLKAADVNRWDLPENCVEQDYKL